MNRLLCPICKKNPCEITKGCKNGLRKTCWSCRINKSGRKEYNIQRKEMRLRIKRQVINHYGGKCNCCGEVNEKFLTIDHINNDGNKYRRSNDRCRLGGIHLYEWIIKNNYPLDLQVLCYNCNCGKNINGGVCPHRDKI